MIFSANGPRGFHRPDQPAAASRLRLVLQQLRQHHPGADGGSGIGVTTQVAQPDPKAADEFCGKTAAVLADPAGVQCRARRQDPVDGVGNVPAAQLHGVADEQGIEGLLPLDFIRGQRLEYGDRTIRLAFRQLESLVSALG